MWKFKEKYAGKLVSVYGFGNVDTNKIKAETIHSLSFTYPNLIKLIEKDEAKATKTAVK